MEDLCRSSSCGHFGSCANSGVTFAQMTILLIAPRENCTGTRFLTTLCGGGALLGYSFLKISGWCWYSNGRIVGRKRHVSKYEFLSRFVRPRVSYFFVDKTDLRYRIYLPIYLLLSQQSYQAQSPYRSFKGTCTPRCWMFTIEEILALTDTVSCFS